MPNFGRSNDTNETFFIYFPAVSFDSFGISSPSSIGLDFPCHSGIPWGMEITKVVPGGAGQMGAAIAGRKGAILPLCKKKH